MFTPNKPLTYFKFQYSVNQNSTRFSHTVIDKLPSLSYRFAEGANWKATDERIRNKWTEMDLWFEKYWTIKNKDRMRNDEAFENDLEKSVTNAYETVKEQWTRKLEKDFEKEFADDLVKFLNSKD